MESILSRQAKKPVNNTYIYNGSSITFITGDGDVMVNATEMAKPFGKNTTEFLSNQQTKNFISALETKLGNPSLKISRGGSNPGTWMQKKLALKFAAWLNPEFELWVYDRIEELFDYGITATKSTIENILSDPDTAIRLLTELKQERLEKDRLKLVAEHQSKELAIQAPKVEYHDKVLQSEALIAPSVIANEMGISAFKLNQLLHQKRVIYKIQNTWVLYSEYQGKALTGPKTIYYKDSLGREMTKVHTYWTEKGRKFIHNLLNPLNTQN